MVPQFFGNTLFPPEEKSPHSMGSLGSLIYPVSSKYIIDMLTCICRGSRAIDGTHFRMTF